MQISVQEVRRARQLHREPRGERELAAVASPEELGARHGVSREEVQKFTESALMASDPARERRLRELAQRIARGSYAVEAEQIVEMAERRALADRLAEL